MPKPKGKKGLKQLCDALSFVIGANLEIAEEEQKAGNTEKAREAADIVNQAVQDQFKYGCAHARTSEARKRLASLKRALARGRRPGRSVGRPR
jgi:hypothetical protein